MALFGVELPPGVYANGTEGQALGRFWRANLVRWIDSTLRSIGGWRRRGDDNVAGRARAILVTLDNNNVAWIAIGTHSGFFIQDRAGVLYNLTPVGFVEGEPDSTFRGGYGNGLYGRGAYGTPRPDTQTPTEVTVWTLDVWGEDVLGTTIDDGRVWAWAPNPAVPPVVVPNAPTCRAIHVTADRILMVLGANGNPRRIAWSDQEDREEYTPAADNYAGDWDLQTAGRLMCAKRVRGGELILTTADAHLATFIGLPFVYSFEQKGTGCGVISQGAAVNYGGRVAWMGNRSFFRYNSGVEELACEVADYVFTDLNRSQAGKIVGWHNSDFGEIWWFYPSKSSTEIDRCVIWSYRENHWNVGTHPKRLCGAERGPLLFPLAVDVNGVVYEHEVGSDFDGEVPYARTGPFMLGKGDNVVDIDTIIPDENTVGDSEMDVITSDQPTGAQYTEGPFTLSERTDVRFAGRIFRIVHRLLKADARIGNFKFNGTKSGMR